MLSRRGFTRTELLVVMAVAGLLVGLVLFAASNYRVRAQRMGCQSNCRQLMNAMSLYTGDSQGLFPPNPDDGNFIPGYDWCSGRAGIGQAHEFDPDILKDQQLSLLWAYLNGNAASFHCPADRRTGNYQGRDPAYRGGRVAAARTYSMNQAVGTIDPGFEATGPGGKPGIIHRGVPSLSVNGPLLNNLGNHRRNSPWRTYGKADEIVAPKPALLWILIDEDAKGLTDAAFAFEMEGADTPWGGPMWIEAPGIYHNGGCGFAFADGHADVHKWLSPARKLPGRRTFISNPQDMKDWAWVQERTSARAQ
jgi:prepilin-type N-terminal cleavage/methylation domain-containing protein/prepilin-type processing-associated H-X9-DG protein